MNFRLLPRLVSALALVMGVGMISATAHAVEMADDFTVRCARLATLSLPGLDLQGATVVEASTATVAGQTLQLPTYCRVRAVVRPALHVEVRLPLDAAWNGGFFQSGCGGLCGDVLTDYPHLFNSSLPGQARGYVTATSDTGHAGSNTDGRWAYNNPVGEEDFAERSIGDTARVGKALLQALYDKSPAKSYFAGCSTGGRLAVKAALKYPAEFNGIVVGAPALDYPGLVGTAFTWLVRTNTDAQGRKVLNADTVTKVAQLYKTTMEQCDTVDGVADGVIADPRLCRVDLRSQSCGITGEPTCLTEQDQRVVALWRQGARDSMGRQLYPGGVPEGSEPYWGLWLTGSPTFQAAFPNGFAEPIALNFLRYLAFVPDAGPTYRLDDFHFDSDPARMTAAAALLNADDPNLSAFQKAGGKMVMYHGWADPLVTPYKTVDYYEAVRQTLGGTDAVDGFLRLFMIPGLDHCGVQRTGVETAFGPGIDERSLDPLSALEQWTDQGKAPDALPLTAFAAHDAAPLWQRNICRFPQRTVVKDPKSDWKDPRNWTCR
jgi:pimeloyl-ACP methyl ester carboxylesterase